MRLRRVCCLSILAFLLNAQALAESPAPESAGLDKLRAALTSAYDKGDIATLVRYIHPDAIIIFPDGRILKGPDDFRAYYDRMFTAPDHAVESLSAEPVIESRTVHNDVGLSYGRMNDKYVLTSGESFNLDSRFTVTAFKSPAGPAETEGWMVRSFHSSTPAFDNEVLTMVVTRATWKAGGFGALVGLVIGIIAGMLLKKRRS